MKRIETRTCVLERKIFAREDIYMNILLRLLYIKVSTQTTPHPLKILEDYNGDTRKPNTRLPRESFR